MGLTIRIKGLSDKESYDCGYLSFGVFRMKVANLISTEFGSIYEKTYRESRNVTDADWAYMEQNCPAEMGPFLFHPDCEGKLTSKECKAIYGWLKDKKLDMLGHNYGVMEDYNMLEHWLNMYFT